MCVLTICKIFRCWHLEAIFRVERCERAMHDQIRHCDRECSPPVLKAEFSRAACSICTTFNTSLTDPLTDFADEAFEAFFYMNVPLMQLFRKDIDRFIDGEWSMPIQRARQRTRSFQAHFLHRRFPLDEVPLQEDSLSEFGRYDNPRSNQVVDMETLVIRPCDETCPRHSHPEAATERPPPPQPQTPSSPPHPARHRPRAIPLSVRIFASPMPRSETQFIERWVEIASDFAGASAAGVNRVLDRLRDREMGGLAPLSLNETIDAAGVDLAWVFANGLYPGDGYSP